MYKCIYKSDKRFINTCRVCRGKKKDRFIEWRSMTRNNAVVGSGRNRRRWDKHLECMCK